MSVTYKKPPLVELIAELRWEINPNEGALAGNQGGLQLAFPQESDEAVVMHFFSLIAAQGYSRYERLIPSGMPAPLFSPSTRFRPTDASVSSPLFQVGKGIFSANALSPNYTSWQAFSPVLRMGLEKFFEAHQAATQPSPNISQLSTRYIDVFGDDLTEGRDVNQFLEEVLGFKLVSPECLNILRKDGTSVKQLIQLEQQIDIGFLTITIGPTFKDNVQALMLDTTVIIQRQVGSDIDAIINALTEARGIIHELFRGITAPIHTLMEPIE